MAEVTPSLFEECSNHLWSDVDKWPDITSEKPLLAHYTSLHVLESMLKHEQIWLSNPLYMNDHEEVRFGLEHGLLALENSTVLQEALSPQHYLAFMRAIYYYREKFARDDLHDLYVASFSVHEQDDDDGKLSMWRGYGAAGNGACIVFDASKLAPLDESPLIIAKVEYRTPDERKHYLKEKFSELADFVSERYFETDDVEQLAYLCWEWIKFYSVFTKHVGFKEEEEWRLVYMGWRDEKRTLAPFMDYHIGLRGIEPKLKLKIAPIDGIMDHSATLENLVSKVILGPTVSSPLAITATKKMLEKLGRERFGERLRASGIPFRNL